MFKVKMKCFSGKFATYYCVACLLFSGFVIGYFIGEHSVNVIAMLSNIATILGFILAARAYFLWQHKDTKSLQGAIVRELLMEMAELDCIISNIFSQSIRDEADNIECIFPQEDQRKYLGKIPSNIDRIEVLIRKYYSIEPSPPEILKCMPKSYIHGVSFEGDVFPSLKKVCHQLKKLNGYSSGDNHLYFLDGLLYTTLPGRAPYDVSCDFNYEQSFSKISLNLHHLILDTERELKKIIS